MPDIQCPNCGSLGPFGWWGPREGLVETYCGELVEVEIGLPADDDELMCPAAGCKHTGTVASFKRAAQEQTHDRQV